MIARKLGLLFLILGFGAAVEATFSARSRYGIGPAGCRILTGKFHGPAYTFEATTTRDSLPPSLQLEVENAFGDVRVLPGEAGRAVVKLRKVVYQPTEARAREFAGGLNASLALSDSTLRVTTNRREMEERDEDVGFETHLEVLAPPGTLLKIQNEHGSVEVEDMGEARVFTSHDSVRVHRTKGAVDVNNRHGDVDVRFVGGALTLYTRHGHAEIADVALASNVTVEHGDVAAARVADLKLTLHHGDLRAEDVRGELDVRGSHAGVTAAAVKGRTTVETSFRGVELRRIAGDVNAKVEHGQIVAEDVFGSLTAEASFERVEARRIGGPVEVRVTHGGFSGEALKQGARVRTSGDDAVLAAFEGPVDVEVERGSARLEAERPLTDTVICKASGGGIVLAVPPQSRFDLDARAEHGEVRVELPEFRITESAPERVAGSAGGGGKSVTLESRRGDVSVEARAASVKTEQ
jgi:DUF4097 and DUF4098 domain-containing protein YvlB